VGRLAGGLFSAGEDVHVPVRPEPAGQRGCRDRPYALGGCSYAVNSLIFSGDNGIYQTTPITIASGKYDPQGAARIPDRHYRRHLKHHHRGREVCSV